MSIFSKIFGTPVPNLYRFCVEMRDDTTGEWILQKEFVTGEGMETFDAKRSVKHQENKISAVDFAKDLYKSGNEKSDVRVRGNVNASTAFINCCWLNGKWYDDPIRMPQHFPDGF